MRSSSSASNAHSTSSETAGRRCRGRGRGYEPVADLAALWRQATRVQHHVAEERPLGGVGHREAEELAARAQARLARDEATHPVLRRVLVGADLHAERGSSRNAQRTGPRRGRAGDAERRRRVRGPRGSGGWAPAASLTAGGTFARDAPRSPPRRRARRRLRRRRSARTPTSRPASSTSRSSRLVPARAAHRRERRAEAARAQRRPADAAHRRGDGGDQAAQGRTPRSRSASSCAAPSSSDGAPDLGARRGPEGRRHGS